MYIQKLGTALAVPRGVPCEKLDGSWEILILTVTFRLVGCAGHSVNPSASVQNSVTGPITAPVSSADLLWQFTQDFNYRLNDKQKSKQNRHAVYAPLESDYGMVYKWFEGDAMGAAKAVHGYPRQWFL